MMSPVAATPLIAQMPECCASRINAAHHSFHHPAAHHSAHAATAHHPAHHAAFERDLLPFGRRKIRLGHGVGAKHDRPFEGCTRTAVSS